MARIACLALALAALSGCAGLDRSVAVLPNTLDDLGQRSEAARTGAQPGDAAMAVRQTRRP